MPRRCGRKNKPNQTQFRPGPNPIQSRYGAGIKPNKAKQTQCEGRIQETQDRIQNAEDRIRNPEFAILSIPFTREIQYKGRL